MTKILPAKILEFTSSMEEDRQGANQTNRELIRLWASDGKPSLLTARAPEPSSSSTSVFGGIKREKEERGD